LILLALICVLLTFLLIWADWVGHDSQYEGRGRTPTAWVETHHSDDPPKLPFVTRARRLRAPDKPPEERERLAAAQLSPVHKQEGMSLPARSP